MGAYIKWTNFLSSLRDLAAGYFNINYIFLTYAELL